MNNLIGQRFGRLLIIKRILTITKRRLRWLCKCDCGNQKIILSDSLKSGKTKSCGCLQKETAKIFSTKHGLYQLNIYNSYHNMKQRCNNPNNHAYKDYGGRGIKVCKRWSGSRGFLNFLEDMGQPPTNKYQIDRINNNKGYYKRNCRWVVSKNNNRNRRDNLIIEYDNKKQCMSAMAEEYNMNPHVLRDRLSSGQSIEKALLTPVRKYIKRKNK